MFQELLSDARCLIDITAPNAEKAIHDRGIVKNEEFFTSGRAVFLDYVKFGSREA